MSRDPTTSCQALRERAELVVELGSDGAGLDASEREHLAHCAECRLAVEELAWLHRQLAKSRSEAPSDEAFAALGARILAQADPLLTARRAGQAHHVEVVPAHQRPSLVWRLREWLSRPMAKPILAVAALSAAMLLALWLTPFETTPSLDEPNAAHDAEGEDESDDLGEETVEVEAESRGLTILGELDDEALALLEAELDDSLAASDDAMTDDFNEREGWLLAELSESELELVVASLAAEDVGEWP